MPKARSVYGMLTLLSCTVILIAQTDRIVPPAIQIDPPTLGHFFDRGGANLRPVIGIAANAFPGLSLAAGSGASFYEVAPSQDSALVVMPGSGAVAWLSLDDSTQSPVPIVGAISGVNRIAFSPTGAVAILYSTASRQAQTVAGLPSAPAVAGIFDLSAMQGELSAIAVDDGGDIVLAALTADTTIVSALTAASAPAQVFRAQRVASIEFLRNSHDAILSDPAESRVIWLRDAAGAANAVVVADASAGVLSPLLAAPSEDGSRAFAVSAAGSIWSIPLSGAMVTSVSCVCQPTQLQRMRGTDVFLLTSSLDRPLAILESGSRGLKIDFVPVEPPRAATAAGSGRGTRR